MRDDKGDDDAGDARGYEAQSRLEGSEILIILCSKVSVQQAWHKCGHVHLPGKRM